ncbi:molybdopterin-guanine dinucleotide biosynthesis protein B [Staphylococcus edaphicus]|uniref:Molybdopterin-guanine dinucleotide biosynthesis protein B n=1 Tax=Staphylococcus edaphicus TaxID=1955013 RepID=A0A2C6WR10_9STAP|nr:molybdopterin-guanine dinucleotide biosynthesis protein B [Staphylococcus edaphicus]PHK50234.1 molybdopterin-guanine dinucleotide biosynthesis protein B [Staphylococcus edaphicus]UQW82168.1 molybdopterin-guanine dinucleotide biosynthesis protein B [Staphylococcus edaphicus]
MILQIVGHKNSGKTTLMSYTINFLKAHQLSVATIKHHGQAQSNFEEADITLQNDQVDHMKHFNAGADQSIVQGRFYQQSVTRNENQSLEEILGESVTIDCNVILVEGFKSAAYDKVVVYKNEQERQTLSRLANVKYFVNLRDKDALHLYHQWLCNYFKIKGRH